MEVKYYFSYSVWINSPLGFSGSAEASCSGEPSPTWHLGHPKPQPDSTVIHDGFKSSPFSLKETWSIIRRWTVCCLEIKTKGAIAKRAQRKNTLLIRLLYLPVLPTSCVPPFPLESDSFLSCLQNKHFCFLLICKKTYAIISPLPPFIFFILKNNKKAERQKRHLQATLDTEAPAESFSITNPLRERSHFFWDLCNK